MKNRYFSRYFFAQSTGKWGFIFFILYASSAITQGAVNVDTFLSKHEITQIQERVFAEKSPLHVGEYQRLQDSAENILKLDPPSITGNKSPGNKNHYFTEGPYCGWFTFWGLWGDYCRDGQINPNANREDYNQAGRMGRESLVLALTYRLSGEQKYLDKLLKYLDVWIVRGDTMMAPQFTNSQSRIEIAVTHITLFYALSLVMEDIAEQPELDQAIQPWLRSWALSVDSWQAENNFEDWRIAMKLVIFGLLGDEKKISDAAEAWKARLSLAIGSNAELVHEVSRTKSLSYSLYALSAMTYGAEVAFHHGIDLYRYKDARGIGLEEALLHHAKFLLKDRQSDWPHPQIVEVKKKELAFLEVANARYSHSLFSDVLHVWGRPFIGFWGVQNMSLTHAKVK